MRRLAVPSLLFVILFSPEALAQWTGTGDAGLVTATSVTVFKGETGSEVAHTLVKDEIVVAHGSGRKLKESSGRARVEFIVQDGKRTKAASGWILLGEGLLRFPYSCSCAQGCWPFQEAGRDVRLNRCVLEGAVEAVRAEPEP